MAYGAAYHDVQLFDDLNGVGAPNVVSSMPSEPMAGFMVVAFDYDNPSEMMADLPQDVPRLLVNRASTDPRVPYVTIDRERGAYEATSFLLALGHRRIGIDCTGTGTPPMIDRLRGYRRAFEAAGLPVDETMLFKGAASSDFQEWPKSFHDLLQRDGRPTALIMHYDNQILHVMEVIHSRGLRVPQDISLIIIDDGPMLSRITPRVSVISEPYGEMGRRAVGMILADAKDDGQERQHVALEPQLVMRESVLPLRT
jgi:LacI family transcriptional regulator